MIPSALRDPYTHADGWLQTVDARVRVVWIVLYILCAALLPAGAWAACVILCALALAALLAAELPVRAFYTRSLLALPFALAALPLLWTAPGPVWAPWGLDPAWGIHLAGLERFLSIGIKAWLSVQAALLLTLSTPFADILLALRWLRVPRLLVAVIGLMWRYLFVMAHAARQMLLARAARSASAAGRRAGGRVTWRARVTGGMAGSLLMRSFEQGERIYAAMLARGYDGEARGLPAPPLTRSGWLRLAAAVFVFSGITLGGALLAA